LFAGGCKWGKVPSSEKSGGKEKNQNEEPKKSLGQGILISEGQKGGEKGREGGPDTWGGEGDKLWVGVQLAKSEKLL